MRHRPCLKNITAKKINTLNFSCKMHFNETIYGENIQSGQNIHITIDDSVAASAKICFKKDTSDFGSATGDRPKIVGMPPHVLRTML